MSSAPYIVGNWKMNGTRALLAEARAINRAAARYPGVQVALAPPFTLVQSLADEAQAIGVGGQDCHVQPKGAHTGDISAPMLADCGASFVIVGHSERRKDHGEDDALVKAKAEAAIEAGLGVIVCVGETLEERDAGQAEAVVSQQVDNSLPALEAIADLPAGKVSVAYEPVWAIGTGRVAEVADVVAMHKAIRTRIEAAYGEKAAGVRILYGGSVNAENAAALLAAEGVGGALVGGASLAAESFAAIIAAAGTEPVD
ncbi:triose-phosphate isomerase [Novosphingobium sp. TH158]|uniref:triose-phosphate isomerase n=1 Tax=Novosphingobium sp. TH158 TaxID=2067455 RepID=UPI000C7B5D4A|nr:triose-phosphate isomerase [Novosphingobium sp. TH158]PLK25830.1 triose-phosphate isomerase [Novosphingobium sp. TH158]